MVRSLLPRPQTTRGDRIPPAPLFPLFVHRYRRLGFLLSEPSDDLELPRIERDDGGRYVFGIWEWESGCLFDVFGYEPRNV